MADPNDLSRELARAETLLDLGREAEAEQRLRSLLTTHPESAPVLVALAHALHRLDRLGEAEDAARRGLAAEPEHHQGHLVLADVLVAREDADGSMAVAHECLRLAPHAWTSHYALARALLVQRRPRVRDAYAASLRAVELAPDLAATHTLVGLCLEGLGDREAAERAYRNALAIDPQHATAQHQLAALHLTRGRLGHGARLLRSAVGQSPQEQMLHEGLDRVLLVLGRRVLWALAGAGLLLGVLLRAEAPWWSRAVVGATFLAAVAVLLHRFRENLPRGVTRWGRGLFGRVPWQGKYLIGLLVLLAVGVLLLAFAPHGVAESAGLALLMVLRVLGIACVVGWVLLAVVNLVRGR